MGVGKSMTSLSKEVTSPPSTDNMWKAPPPPAFNYRDAAFSYVRG